MHALPMLVLLLAASAAHATSFVNFEGGHVRPLAFVPTADLLIAVNDPAARISVFRATGAGLVLQTEVPVGLEPVAVATRLLPSGRVEAWVVNHLSDSVSIVEIDPANVAGARVTRTLLVGDEPRDIIFAGSSGSRAFVTTAHRGQHRPGDAQSFVPGVGRADVWVFDANALGAALGGTPIAILTLLGDTPRALAASADGHTVYAAVFRSGNGTTSLNELTVSSLGLPPPPNGATPDAPPTGLIVKRDATTGQWLDEIGRDWSAQVPFGLPDYDVFALDADAAVPVQTGAIARVGTVLFAMAVRGATGKLYVANTDARNAVRFEPNVRGNMAQSRITIVDGATVTPVHLNPHINYGTIPGPPAEVAESLAFPVGMAFSADEQTLFVAALGSGRVGVFDADQLEAGSAAPREQLAVGGGPTAVVVDAARDRLYVMNRFDHAIAVVGNASSPTRAVLGTVAVGWDPTPSAVNAGRRFLYDARTTSAHGDAACASCHVFGDVDDLAWDLGNPFAPLLTIPGQPLQSVFESGLGFGPVTYHPMKGPLLTQSLRGLPDTGPLHWRGDRSAASSAGDPYDADGNFKTFAVAFPGLLGGPAIAPADMQAFTDFVLSLRYPPNPYRALDDVPTAAQAAGEIIFTTSRTDGPSARGGGCRVCHALPAGTNGGVAFEFNSELKVPHLRNEYQKVGRFGAVLSDHVTPPYVVGDQVRGFGLEFNGSLGSLVDFHSAFPLSLTQREQVGAFVLAFDTGLRPAVGEQVTVTSASVNDAALLAQLALLTARDDAGDCEVVAHGRVGGDTEGWRYAGGGSFVGRSVLDPLQTTADLLAVATVTGQEITFTCVPPRNGRRYGNDADEDLVPDADETAAGSNPYDPASVPASFSVVPIESRKLALKDRTIPLPDPSKRRFAFKASTKLSPASNRIVPPPPGSPGDPRVAGATLIVYDVDGTPEEAEITLPAGAWTLKGSPAAPKGYQYKNTDPAGPVKKVVVAANKLIITGGGARWGYSLDEAAQGELALRMVLGTGVEWCTAPVAGKVDTMDKFIGLPAAAPGACVPF